MSEIDHQAYLSEMRKRIRKVYRKKSARGADKISPGEELRSISRKHQGKLGGVPNDVALWPAFYDEAVAFWFAVWATYKEKITGPADTKLICQMALAGRILQDLFCIRKLVECGFFVQSNVVARASIEAIDVMHLLNSRPELAAEFQQITENVDSSKFWHAHCSRDKLHRLVKQRWLWFFEGDDEVAASFYGARGNYLDLVGMSAHPSFAASFSSFMDSSKGESSNIAENAMGATSQMSKFTLHLVIYRIFEYGILWSGPEIALYKSDEKLETEPLLYDNIKKGLSALASIVRATGQHRDDDPFYPQFKTYWPRASFED